MSKFVFVINVTFDTPNGFVRKKYVRDSFQKVIKLLESFDLLATSITITFNPRRNSKTHNYDKA